jgi:hypothetical protein
MDQTAADDMNRERLALGLAVTQCEAQTGEPEEWLGRGRCSPGIADRAGCCAPDPLDPRQV